MKFNTSLPKSIISVLIVSHHLPHQFKGCFKIDYLIKSQIHLQFLVENVTNVFEKLFTWYQGRSHQNLSG